MREYSKVSPKFWISKMSNQLRKIGIYPHFVSLYLISAPYSNMIGVYYLPLSSISKHVGISLRKVKKAIEVLKALNFCDYDYSMEYVWVKEMAFHQLGELKENDHRIKYCNREYKNLPELIFNGDFFSKYVSFLKLKEEKVNSDVNSDNGLTFIDKNTKRKKRKYNKAKVIKPSKLSSETMIEPSSHTPSPFEAPLQAPSKPEERAEEEDIILTTGEELEERGCGGEKEGLGANLPPLPTSPVPQKVSPDGSPFFDSPVDKQKKRGKLPKTVKSTMKKTMSRYDETMVAVFEHWKKIMSKRSDVLLDEQRKRVIKRALSKFGYDEAQLKKAIEGCANSAWYMGENPDGMKHNSLHVIFRNADQIEKFIEMADGMRGELNRDKGLNETNKRNIEEGQKWVERENKNNNDTSIF